MDFDLSDLCQQVMTARGAERPLYIRGGGSHDFYGEPIPAGLPGSAVLDMSGYQGIVSYQPSELVVTAKAGTRVSDIEAALSAEGQMLAFEPPRFAETATVGGMVATGLSGPRRMAVGSLRDFVLGTRLLDSSGKILSFGGEVMKNVAGYDISRLLAGSMGIFGALMEVSLKVAPQPQLETSCVLEVSESDALSLFSKWRSQPLPISATCWVADGDGKPGQLFVRISGSAPAVSSGLRVVGGDTLPDSEARALWTTLRDQTHAFFVHKPLWRVAVPPKTGAMGLGATLIEWNGGLRWLAADHDTLSVEGARTLRERVSRAGGHATLFRYASRPVGVPVFHPLQAGLRNINQRLKQELDPVGIFNRGRLFPEF